MIDASDDGKFVFLGSYVNRGMKGIEVISLIMCLKIANPDKITLIKGKSE